MKGYKSTLVIHRVELLEQAFDTFKKFFLFNSRTERIHNMNMIISFQGNL